MFASEQSQVLTGSVERVVCSYHANKDSSEDNLHFCFLLVSPYFLLSIASLLLVSSCCKGGKCDCCMSDIFKFLLSGTDGGGSGICAIVVLAMV